METRKLVQRKQDKDDSRFMRVYLTKTGKKGYEHKPGHQPMTS